MKVYDVKIKYPRKKKKQLKKHGEYPKFSKVFVIDNTATSNINNVTFNSNE